MCISFRKHLTRSQAKPLIPSSSPSKPNKNTKRRLLLQPCVGRWSAEKTRHEPLWQNCKHGRRMRILMRIIMLASCMMNYANWYRFLSVTMCSNGSITTQELSPVLVPFQSRKSRNSPVSPKRVPKFEGSFFLLYFCSGILKNNDKRLS